ncbi:MAG TPA: CsbD family protein [Gemmatimonadaceae bacterium]|nr:CsbD family protein [Gemmatimonadaceae bacterium]
MDKNNNMADKGMANEIKGNVKETVGKVRGDLGDAVDNSSEHLKGRAQQAKGNIQKNAGKAEQKIDENLNRSSSDYDDDGAKKY